MAEELDVAPPRDISVFETTIRVLGGLLATHALSQKQVFLDRAVEMADHLLPAFGTKSGIPFSDVNLRTGAAHAPAGSRDASTSEATTLQLEFAWVAARTGRPELAAPAERVNAVVAALPKEDGLVPYYVNVDSARFSRTTLTLGALL